MTPWIVFITIGLGTYALRASMFVLLGERALPAWADAPLALVAPAAVAALVASMTLTDGERASVSSVAELLAIVVGFVVTRRTGNVMHAIAVGLPVFWLAQFAIR